MIEMTLAEIAGITGGAVRGDASLRITGAVEFDSRQVAPGGLFVAFAGAKADGHDFAGQARAAGAVAVLGSRAVDGDCVVVADPLAALAALARAHLARLPELCVLAVTGSSGKTSTKDFMAQLLAHLGPTVASAGSHNNELGVPYTALRAGPATRFLVLEMGARGPGQVRQLCDITPPRVGVVVNVGVAHIGEFGSIEAIAAAKGELVAALPAGGVAVLNFDDERVRAMAGHTAATVVGVGEHPGATLRAEDAVLDERGRAYFTLVTPSGRDKVQLGVTGAHQVTNALLAAGAASAVGFPDADLGRALGGLRLVSTRRMDVFDRADGVTVIDDSYNANPASTEAALRALAAVGAGRRRVAVLGYLAELGEREQAGHEQVGRLAAELGVEALVAVEQVAAGISHGAQSVASWGGESVQVGDQDAAVSWLRAWLRPGDVVLVKGSRYRTWAIADALRGDHCHSADALRGDHCHSADALRGEVAYVDEVAPCAR